MNALQTLATQHVVQRPAASVSPGGFLDLRAYFFPSHHPFLLFLKYKLPNTEIAYSKLEANAMLGYREYRSGEVKNQLTTYNSFLYKPRLEYWPKTKFSHIIHGCIYSGTGA